MHDGLEEVWDDHGRHLTLIEVLSCSICGSVEVVSAQSSQPSLWPFRF